MNNIKKDGIIILNSDDSFYKYHKKVAIKKIESYFFGIKINYQILNWFS